MRKSLLKLMVRFSLPISLLSVFGALSGCARIGRITGGGPTGGSILVPESVDVNPMAEGGDVVELPGEILEVPAEPEVPKDGVPDVTAGVMLPPPEQAPDVPPET